MLAGILVAGILVAGGVVYFVNAESARLLADRGEEGSAPRAPAQGEDASPVKLPTVVERTPAIAPGPRTDRPASRKGPGPKAPSGEPTEKLFTDDPEPPAMPDAAPEKKPDAGEPKPPHPDSAKSAAASSEPNKSTPAPNAAAPPIVKSEPPAASPEEIAAVRKLLAAARASLADRDFSGAEDQLAQATLEATSPKLLDEVERLEFLAGYYNDFWDAVRQHLDQLNAAETINVNGEELSIVEASPDKLIFRAAGKRYEYELGKLPGKLAFWLAKSWLDEGEPPSLVVLGAYHALDAKGDRQQARALFEQAGAKGLDVRLLLAELDANMNDK
jgi:hypothetical protein